MSSSPLACKEVPLVLEEFGDDLFVDTPPFAKSPLPFTDEELEQIYSPSPESSATPTVLNSFCPYPTTPPLDDMMSAFWTPWKNSTWNPQGSWVTESTQVLDAGHVSLPDVREENDQSLSTIIDHPAAVSSDLEDVESLSETDSWSEPEEEDALSSDVKPTQMIRRRDGSTYWVDLSHRLPERTPYFYEYMNVYREDLQKLYQNVYEFGKRHGMIYFARGPESDRNYCKRKFCEFMFETMYNHWNAAEEVKEMLPLVNRPGIRERFGWSVDLQMIDCLHSDNLMKQPELLTNPFRPQYKSTYHNNPFAYVKETKQDNNLFV